MMNSVLRYEIKAEAFRIITGHMPPGKDAAAGSYPESFESRALLWEYWLKSNSSCIDAMFLSFERMTGVDDE